MEDRFQTALGSYTHTDNMRKSHPCCHPLWLLHPIYRSTLILSLAVQTWVLLCIQAYTEPAVSTFVSMLILMLSQSTPLWCISRCSSFRSLPLSLSCLSFSPSLPRLCLLRLVQLVTAWLHSKSQDSGFIRECEWKNVAFSGRQAFVSSWFILSVCVCCW